MEIVELLNLEMTADLEILPGGVRAIKRPDIARLAYEIIIISSIYDSIQQSSVEEFLGGANRALFEDLYKICNGLKIGSSKFNVCGFLTGNQSVGVPWNIEVPNLATRANRPQGSLIVGNSTTLDKSDNRVGCYHSIQVGPEIYVTPESDFSTVLRSYASVSDWLRSEVALALNDRANW